MKRFITNRINQQRHTADEIVQAAAYEYGHLVENWYLQVPIDHCQNVAQER